MQDLVRKIAELERQIEAMRTIEVPGGWKDYTPLVSSQTGSFTTVSSSGKYSKVGDIVFVTIQISITTNGTAATGIIATIPVAADASVTNRQLISAREFSINGFHGFGYITNPNNVVIRKYDNSYLGGDGFVIVASGFYRSA